jgi:adenosylcobinamide-phosphate synthase
MTTLLCLLSLLIELAFGYPQRLFAAVGHPVTWIGALIAWLDRTLNRDADRPGARRLLGALALLIVVLLPMTVAYAIQQVFGGMLLGLLVTAALGSSLLAQRSLAAHVKAVADALDSGGLPAGRKAVSQIVGRDPDRLDEAAVCRAAIESMAENFSDGVVAPAFWLGVGGLPAGVAYKAANTADSMIGHRTARHQAFGWAAARFDDLINLPASRLTALLIVVAASVTPGADAANAWRAVWRDAKRHRSPNAGWPEAAMAGALGLSLAGPRVYGGVAVDDAEMGAGGRRGATAADIRRALRLYWTADWVMIGVIAMISVAVWMA